MLSLFWVYFWEGYRNIRISFRSCVGILTSCGTYTQIRPILDSFQPLANLLEAVAGLLQQILYSFSYSIRLSFCSEQCDLVG